MKLLNATRMQANYVMGMDSSGREYIVTVIKGTFILPTSSEDALLAAEQVPLVDADVFTGEPGFSAPLYECDYALVKPRCDVLLNGSAYAPGGRRARLAGYRRCLLGQPFSIRAVKHALESGPLWRRHRWALEVSIQTEGREHISTNTFPARQIRQIAAMVN